MLNATGRCATLIVSLLLLDACTSTTQTGTVGVERKQLMRFGKSDGN